MPDAAKPVAAAPPATFEVRLAAAHDAERLASLATQLGYPMDEATARARFAEAARDHRHALAVVERKGAVIGWMELEVRSNLAGGRAAEIMGLVVDQAERRSGAGKALLAFAERWAAERHLPTLRVRSNAKREEAASFYPAAGFELEKMQRVFVRKVGGG